MRYYIDTCVWIDFVEGKNYAEDLLVSIIENEDTILMSEMVFKEFSRYKSYSSINLAFELAESKGLIEIVQASKTQEIEAMRLSIERKLPFGDALHSILSRDNDAILISKDKHFLELKDICDLKLF
jgi:predicted nucleic acid-binding protein